MLGIVGVRLLGDDSGVDDDAMFVVISVLPPSIHSSSLHFEK